MPTPLGAVGTAAGVEAVIDISQMSTDLVPKRSCRAHVKKWLGAYFFKVEVAFVDFSQAAGRARFTEAHELGHRVIPWHR